MISAKLKGGLGNIMFQIAATYALAMDNDDECVFRHQVSNQHGTPSIDNTNGILSRVNFAMISDFNPQHFYREPHFHYNKIPYINNLLIDGYFQSEKYFSHRREDIINLFSPTEEVNEYLTSKYSHLFANETIGVHVRRGDYLSLPNHHPVCDIEYYEKALSLFTDDKKYDIIMFSDDVKWCKDNFDSSFHFVDGESPAMDMFLMSKCSHNIIANSSFSWWGAWLNENKDKRVIAPKKWFGKALRHNTDDVCCSEWELL
jgi:hypothetical protein